MTLRSLGPGQAPENHDPAVAFPVPGRSRIPSLDESEYSPSLRNLTRHPVSYDTQALPTNGFGNLPPVLGLSYHSFDQVPLQSGVDLNGYTASMPFQPEDPLTGLFVLQHHPVVENPMDVSYSPWDFSSSSVSPHYVASRQSLADSFPSSPTFPAQQPAAASGSDHPLTCCNYRFANRALLKRHKKESCKQRTQAPQHFQCGRCQRRFARRENLRKHLEQVEGRSRDQAYAEVRKNYAVGMRRRRV